MIYGSLRDRLESLRPVALALGVLVLAAWPQDAARAEPPIRSPQDAHCRNEARNRVFATPDPQNLGAHEIGRGIYNSCMRQISGAGRSRKGGRRHHHRRRHR